MSTQTQKDIHKIELDEKLCVRRSPVIETERASAIRALLEKNTFKPHGHAGGPYHVRVGLEHHRLALHIRDAQKNDLPVIIVSLTPLRRLVRDYFLICESYQMAYAQGDRNRLETIDMARRGLHDEGADLLRDRLDALVETDHTTARGLFTLLCILHIGSVQPW